MPTDSPHDDFLIKNQANVDYLQITTTTENQQEAEELINFITSKNIVACAQVQGPEQNPRKDTDFKWRCKFKTSKTLLMDVKNKLSEFYKKDDYAIKVMPIVKGSEHFFQWLGNQLENR